MTKRTLIGALVVALALIGTACKSSSTKPEAPTVTTDVVNGGGTLRLTWNAVENATSYEIKAGDSTYTTEATTFDVSAPAASIQVWAVNGTTKSDSAAPISCKIVESTIEFFGDVDLTHPNGFGFNSDGGVVGCTLSYPSSGGMDFYGDSSNSFTEFRLVPAKVSLSRAGDAIKAASGSYDSITMADTLGAYSGTQLAVMVDSTYYLRLSSDTTNTWSTVDNFAKARVDSIVGKKISLTTAYQKIKGLRWLVK